MRRLQSRAARPRRLRPAAAMARLAALLAPLLALTTVLVVAPAAADTHGGRLFNLAPRPRLQELSIADIEETLDMLTDLLEETSLPSGEKGFVSQMAAPTLYASTTLCQKHTQIYWEMLKKPTENVWPQLSKCSSAVFFLLIPLGANAACCWAVIALKTILKICFLFSLPYCMHAITVHLLRDSWMKITLR